MLGSRNTFFQETTMADNTIINFDSALGYRYETSSHPNNLEIDIGATFTTKPEDQASIYIRPYVGSDFSPSKNNSAFTVRAGTEIGSLIYDSKWENCAPSFSVRPFILTGIRAGKNGADGELQGGVQFKIPYTVAFLKTSVGITKPFSDDPVFPSARIMVGIEFPVKKPANTEDQK